MKIEGERIDEACAIVSSGYSSDPVTAHWGDYGFVGMVPKPYMLNERSKAVTDAFQK